MRSILTVTTPATASNLTTLKRVKAENSITDSKRDDVLSFKIAEASADVEAYLGFKVAQETVSELFWHEANDDTPAAFTLNRWPIVQPITSVTLDDVVVDPSLYRLDPEVAQLYALDANGFPIRWIFNKSAIIAYSGGYLLPGQQGANLPAGIEGATVSLVTDFWKAMGRDPSIKSVEIPGVIRRDYWVGAIGEEGELPPRVQMKLAPWRRAKAA